MIKNIQIPTVYNRKFYFEVEMLDFNHLGCKGMPDEIIFIEIKMFPNNLAFPSQTSKLPMVE